MILSSQVPGNDDRNTLNALWGKLGSEILMQNWETALEDLNRLKDVIESNVSFSISSSFSIFSSTLYVKGAMSRYFKLSAKSPSNFEESLKIIIY